MPEIIRFSRTLRETGSMSPAALTAMSRMLAGRCVVDSAETGSGASTLLFSQASSHHTAFTLPGPPLDALRSSPLLRSETVEFIEGPTQQTLPRHSFGRKLQAILIDGPHAYPFPDLEYFFLYPHLEPAGLLILDDIQIPTIHNLFRFLRADRMFRLIETRGRTAFFERTDAPLFDPFADNWWTQAANRRTHWRHDWRSLAARLIRGRLRK